MESRTEFGKMLTDMGLMGSGAEIGVRYGTFSKIILDSWAGRHLYLVDAWRPMKDWIYSQPVDAREFERWKMRTEAAIAQHRRRCTLLQMPSVDAAKTLRDGVLDWVYIDANHAYTHVLNDLRAWIPKVKPGGLVAGHDYLDRRPTKESPVDYGVREAVDKIAAARGVTVYTTMRDASPSWWFEK